MTSVLELAVGLENARAIQRGEARSGASIGDKGPTVAGLELIEIGEDRSEMFFLRV